MPDGRMVEALGEHFEVGVLSGLPSVHPQPESLQAVAGRGGYDAVLCYWEILESREASTAGAAVSWVPLIGPLVADRSQQMRIRMQAIVLDVQTGRWSCILPPPLDDERASSMWNRETRDFDQVQRLLAAGVHVTVDTLLGTAFEPGP